MFAAAGLRPDLPTIFAAGRTGRRPSFEQAWRAATCASQNNSPAIARLSAER